MVTSGSTLVDEGLETLQSNWWILAEAFRCRAEVEGAVLAPRGLFNGLLVVVVVVGDAGVRVAARRWRVDVDAVRGEDALDTLKVRKCKVKIIHVRNFASLNL